MVARLSLCHVPLNQHPKQSNRSFFEARKVEHHLPDLAHAVTAHYTSLTKQNLHPQSPHSNLLLLQDMESSPEQDISTADARPLIRSSVSAWNAIERLLQDEHCIIDGHSLDIASVFAVVKSACWSPFCTDHV